MLNKEILVVDDDQDLRTMIRSVFESAGYTQITTAASGEEALALMAKKTPGIILLDVMMPGMDGFELLQEIRAVSTVRLRTGLQALNWGRTITWSSRSYRKNCCCGSRQF